MSYQDIRQYIKTLEKTGDIVRIKQEVDWELEVGAISRRCGEMAGPAVFFEKIKDYPDGYSIFSLPFDTPRRWAISFNLDPNSSVEQFQDEVKRKMRNRIKPEIVKDGPCKENIITGEKVDLFRFPSPLFTDADGGRYLGTQTIEIIKDPDSDWTNWGVYRMMLCDEKHLAVNMGTWNQGGNIFVNKFKSHNKVMPMAIAIGADPSSHWAAQFRVPVSDSEVDLAGAFRDEPVELIKCETNDIYVPANAEIIIEGEMLPDVQIREGPFCENHAHVCAVRSNPVFRATAITHRNNPILTVTPGGIFGMNPGTMPAEIMVMKEALKERGIPLVEINAPQESFGMLLIVSVKRTGDANIASQIDHIVHSVMRGRPTMIMVMDDDVNIFDMREVMHTLAARCHPGKNIRIHQPEMCINTAPFLSSQEKELSIGANVLFDCTWPVERSIENIPRRIIFRDSYPQEIRDKILNNWHAYGFK